MKCAVNRILLRAAPAVIAALALASLAAQAASKSTRVYNGAIAYHRDSGGFGYAVDLTTARAAQVEALKQCAHANCEIVARLRNDCGAVASGAKRFAVGKGATRQEAETKALRACAQACEIVVWACTR
jgi:hypothetical protein